MSHACSNWGRALALALATLVLSGCGGGGGGGGGGALPRLPFADALADGNTADRVIARQPPGLAPPGNIAPAGTADPQDDSLGANLTLTTTNDLGDALSITGSGANAVVTQVFVNTPIVIDPIGPALVAEPRTWLLLALFAPFVAGLRLRSGERP